MKFFVLIFPPFRRNTEHRKIRLNVSNVDVSFIFFLFYFIIIIISIIIFLFLFFIFHKFVNCVVNFKRTPQDDDFEVKSDKGRRRQRHGTARHGMARHGTFDVCKRHWQSNTSGSKCRVVECEKRFEPRSILICYSKVPRNPRNARGENSRGNVCAHFVSRWLIAET